jgi:hypothetical protein
MISLLQETMRASLSQDKHMAQKFIRPLWLLLLRLSNIPHRWLLNRTKYHMGNLHISNSPLWDSRVLRMVLLVRSLSLSSLNRECTSNRRFNKLSRSRKLKFREQFSRSNRKLRFRVRLNPSLRLARMANTLSPCPSLSLSHMLSHHLNSSIRLSRSLVHTVIMTMVSNTSNLIPKVMAKPSQHNRSRRAKTLHKCNKLSRLNKPSHLRRNRSPKPHLRLRLDTSRRDRRTCTTRRRLTRIRTYKHGFNITHKEGKISLARLISSPYQV